LVTYVAVQYKSRPTSDRSPIDPVPIFQRNSGIQVVSKRVCDVLFWESFQPITSESSARPACGASDHPASADQVVSIRRMSLKGLLTSHEHTIRKWLAPLANTRRRHGRHWA